jgi:Cytochrome P450
LTYDRHSVTAHSGPTRRTRLTRQARLGEAGRVKRFLPFSDGRRDCVGQALAKVSYTSTLARLLARFTFKLAPEVSAQGPGQPVLMTTSKCMFFCLLTDEFPILASTTSLAMGVLQMGGPEGVRASELMSMTLQPGRGLLMHCIPRV